jgi:hypothetical protein
MFLKTLGAYFVRKKFNFKIEYLSKKIPVFILIKSKNSLRRKEIKQKVLLLLVRLKINDF